MSTDLILFLLRFVSGLLLIGVFARFSAAVALAISISIFHLDYYLHNGGDRLRSIGLFMLIV